MTYTFDTLPRLTRDEIKAGDCIAFLGGRHHAGIDGQVVKANRVNLTISCLYMGRIPLEVKVKRSNLEGRGVVARGENHFAVLAAEEA